MVCGSTLIPMRPTITLDQLFGTRGRIAVLRVLWGLQVPATTAEIARRARMTHPAVAEVLDAFSALGIAGRAPAGRGHTYWLNREHVFVEEVVGPAFLAERDVPDMLAAEIEEGLSPFTVSVYLFGSYARGDQDATSDIDVVAVTEDEAAASAAQPAVEALSARLRGRFGAELSAIAYTRRQASELIRRAPELYRSVSRDGIRLSGLSLDEWTADEE